MMMVGAGQNIDSPILVAVRSKTVVGDIVDTGKSELERFAE